MREYRHFALLLALLLFLSFDISPTQAQACFKHVFDSSPPRIVETVRSTGSTVTLNIENAWIERISATGSMRPAIQDGSWVIVTPPALPQLVPGRVILFYLPGRTDLKVLHRIYAEEVDSMIPSLLLGTGPSGWTLAWDTNWYEPGVVPPPPPLEARYWLTWGDNNCLPDFWQVRYKDILGIVVGVI